MNTLKQIKSNAKTYNRFMTDEYLDELHPLRQLAFAHPFDRNDLARGLKNDGIIDDDQLQEWKRRKDKLIKKQIQDE